MPYAHNDECHQCNGAFVSKDVNEDLGNWLTNITGDRGVKVLDGEEERYH